jgi:accessory gene regulator protein AgrB
MVCVLQPFMVCVLQPFMAFAVMMNDEHVLRPLMAFAVAMSTFAPRDKL